MVLMNYEETDLLEHSKGHFQGRKYVKVWLIFTYLSLLISGNDMLPKCIAVCSFSWVIPDLFPNFNGVD